MVRHKKGYTTIAIIIVAVLFFIAAAVYQTSKVRTIAYHSPSEPGGQANSSSNRISPVPTSSVSPAQAPTFSAPTIFSPSVIPTPTVTQKTQTVKPTEFL